jgi:hypothetical protein
MQPSLIAWILAVYGVAFLLSDAKILSDWIPIRPLLKRVKFFKELLECYFCSGLWIGAGFWLLLYWPHPWKKEALLYLPAGAAGAYLLDLVAHLIETRILTSFVDAGPDEEDD